MIRVMVMGALGRMGDEVCRAIDSEETMELAAAVDPAAGDRGESVIVKSGQVAVKDSKEKVDPKSIDVMVDFTVAESAVENITWSLGNRIQCVVGTTGIPEEDLSRLEGLSREKGANVLIASNFALGAVLMMNFCEAAAGVFDQCEIIEYHHRGKKDAPSGTAITTARRIEKAMEASEVPECEDRKLPGTRGGRMGPVCIHSLRLDGLVAHQEVIFGSTGERLTIRHDTIDRSCFMPGVILAIKEIERLPGLTFGIEPLLGLTS